jgi:hypothetical protein
MRTLTPWASPDGLTWREGGKLDTKAFDAYLKSYDTDPAAGLDSCWFTASNFQESPAMLLLQGIVECSGLCEQTPTNQGYGSWISLDGLSWTPTSLPYFDYARGISGGSSGFIGVDSSGKKPTLWLSADGRSWHRGGLPAAATAAGSQLNPPVSIAGGYVLPGMVRIKGRNLEGGPGCVRGPDPNLYQGALWWSPNGTTWTRASLSGASPSASEVHMWVFRVDDHTVVADLTTLVDGNGNTNTTEWASRDGKTWTRLTGTPVLWNGLGGSLVAGRDRGLVLGNSIYPDDPNRYWPSLSCFDDSLTLVTLQQIGSIPAIAVYTTPQLALGPTGLLVTGDGSRFWIGVPMAG